MSKNERKALAFTGFSHFLILLFFFIVHRLFSRHEARTPPPTKIIDTTLKQVDKKVLFKVYRSCVVYFAHGCLHSLVIFYKYVVQSMLPAVMWDDASTAADPASAGQPIVYNQMTHR